MTALAASSLFMLDHDIIKRDLIDSRWPDLSQQPISSDQRAQLLDTLPALLKEHNACLIAHYYVDADLQELARGSGGMIGDSLQMAQFGMNCDADTLIICGVKFMGETAKILSPYKRVLMPTLEATCSLDLACPIDEFNAFCNQHPERTVVVYANTSAAVKARADWVVTSSIALDVVNHLKEAGEPILWAPDKHLGHYIQTQTQADMILWHASCIVHNEFKGYLLNDLKQQYPGAKVLVHPESPASVVEQADVVGSTAHLLKATQTLNDDTFIVATDGGILHEMQRYSPNKRFIVAPTGGSGANCRSCGHCPWMAQNTLQQLQQCFDKNDCEILLDPELMQAALKPLQRMVDFQNQQREVCS